MRTIKFRGKDIEIDEWIYGDLIQRIGYTPSIMFHYESSGKARYYEYPVKRETVGQFTGLLDKNGKEIYEGDIVDFDDKPYCVNGSKYQGAVVMHNGAWCVQHYEKCFDVHLYSPLFADDFANRKTIILGNIHDNTELLKEDEA